MADIIKTMEVASASSRMAAPPRGEPKALRGNYPKTEDERRYDQKRSLQDQALSFMSQAVKMMLLINGAAAVAVMTLLGSGASSRLDFGFLAKAIFWFGMGALASAVTMAIAHIAQAILVELDSPKGGFWFAVLRSAGILCWCLSGLLFAYGAYLASISVGPTF